MKKAITAILMLVLCAVSISALRNPAAAYCTALGYEYVIENTAEGDLGLCRIDSTHTFDAWRFLQGAEGVRYNYCTKEGYATKVVHDNELCARFLTDSCAVCVLKEGKEQEVTDLMGLSFAETECGDGSCGFPEDDKTCPEDCEGKMPVIERMSDESEPSLGGKSYTATILIVAGAIIIIGLLCWVFYSIGKRKSRKKKSR